MQEMPTDPYRRRSLSASPRGSTFCVVAWFFWRFALSLSGEKDLGVLPEFYRRDRARILPLTGAISSPRPCICCDRGTNRASCGGFAGDRHLCHGGEMRDIPRAAYVSSHPAGKSHHALAPAALLREPGMDHRANGVARSCTPGEQIHPRAAVDQLRRHLRQEWAADRRTAAGWRARSSPG